ncbi:hypothetical protein ACFVGN_05705 [Streptomyces sp. NPDC057757]|uniref:hypothetical protein n=1 Tax=Streptomyces sp. NPDC057757 TaxID=3346241 RepID=UPI00368C6E2C
MILDRELPIVARVRGVKKAALELEEARLWDRLDGGWEIHDYLEYQRDREQVQADRAANAARQKAWRDRQRTSREAAAKGSSNAPSNGVTDDIENAPQNTSATGTRHDDDTTTQEKDAEGKEEQQFTAFRNAVSNTAPTRPNPPSPSEKEKEEGQLATRAGSDDPPRIGDRPRIPAASRPLVDAISAAGLIGIGWDLQSSEWFLIEALIQRCGLPALVASATASAQGARSRPRSGRYFLPGWRSLPDASAPGVDVLPAQQGGEVVALGKSRQQQETDDWADRAMARARARMQESS